MVTLVTAVKEESPSSEEPKRVRLLVRPRPSGAFSRLSYYLRRFALHLPSARRAQRGPLVILRFEASLEIIQSSLGYHAHGPMHCRWFPLLGRFFIPKLPREPKGASSIYFRKHDPEHSLAITIAK